MDKKFANSDKPFAARSQQRALFAQALKGLESYEMAHPYGGPLESLFEALSPYCLQTAPGVPFQAGGQPEQVH